ncbi:hypothetical protein DOTSEDRAFT_33829 [Dothistroma septosporum NZE10]|uniref:Uncharacterized protein n=1 Tax=Dothistroma septosporum (strain NZE10 / CBS 128990) TaxID=675120 RepID=N1PSE6_DOTSN|nr:hypothetical protein DOTSEDRAFT_33829 [Dothistroma septosporum NZE10]
MSQQRQSCGTDAVSAVEAYDDAFDGALDLHVCAERERDRAAAGACWGGIQRRDWRGTFGGAIPPQTDAILPNESKAALRARLFSQISTNNPLSPTPVRLALLLLRSDRQAEVVRLLPWQTAEPYTQTLMATVVTSVGTDTVETDIVETDAVVPSHATWTARTHGQCRVLNSAQCTISLTEEGPLMYLGGCISWWKVTLLLGHLATSICPNPAGARLENVSNEPFGKSRAQPGAWKWPISTCAGDRPCRW